MNDPCAPLRKALNNIEKILKKKKAEEADVQGLLDHYRNLINERVEYTKEDRAWIRKFIANCKTASDAYKNSASAFDVIDNNRPLISAANSRGIAVGKLRDEIRELNGKRKAAKSALEDCLKQNQQTKRCLKPRYGRGFVGVPCKNPLGESGICRNHG